MHRALRAILLHMSIVSSSNVHVRASLWGALARAPDQFHHYPLDRLWSQPSVLASHTQAVYIWNSVEAH
jgi:hypothetical protein